MPIFKKPVITKKNNNAPRGAEEDMETFLESFDSFSSQAKELSGEELQAAKDVFNELIDGFGDKLFDAEDKEQLEEAITELNKDDQELLLKKLASEGMVQFEWI